jgi:hypothetical protein
MLGMYIEAHLLQLDGQSSLFFDTSYAVKYINRNGRTTKLALPVDFLDVLVNLLGQVVAALLPAVFENLAATLRGHALAETMDACPATDFRLIRSFWHFLLTSVHSASFLN